MRSSTRLTFLGFGLLVLITATFLMFGSRMEAAILPLMEGSRTMIAVAVFAALAGDVLLPVPSSVISAAAAV